MGSEGVLSVHHCHGRFSYLRVFLAGLIHDCPLAFVTAQSPAMSPSSTTASRSEAGRTSSDALPTKSTMKSEVKEVESEMVIEESKVESSPESPTKRGSRFSYLHKRIEEGLDKMGDWAEVVNDDDGYSSDASGDSCTNGDQRKKSRIQRDITGKEDPDKPSSTVKVEVSEKIVEEGDVNEGPTTVAVAARQAESGGIMETIVKILNVIFPLFYLGM